MTRITCIVVLKFCQQCVQGLPIQKFHDIGRDRYGGRAPRQFGKRSRRPHKIGLRVCDLGSPF
jgi:hypothetical protein